MKITKIDQFEISLPYFEHMPKSWSSGRHTQNITLIKVHTDEGIEGVGEGGAVQSEDFIGADPLNMNLTTMGGPMAMAMFDIVGKSLGVPAHRLMGSKHWDRVPVGFWSPPLEPEEFAAMAKVGAELGFTNHKLKARPWNIVETVKAMTREAGPDYCITVDPNFAFGDLHTSLKLARELEDYNVTAFEDPFPYLPGWHQYRDFRRHTRIPLVPHVANPQMIMSAIRAEAADAFNTSGEVERVKINAGIAAAAGLPVWLQVVALGTGVSGAYGTHVHSVIPNASIPSDSLHFIRENDMVFGALTPKDGHVEVPDAPGLGVELDMEAVEHYRIG